MKHSLCTQAAPPSQEGGEQPHTHPGRIRAGEEGCGAVVKELSDAFQFTVIHTPAPCGVAGNRGQHDSLPSWHPGGENLVGEGY